MSNRSKLRAIGGLLNSQLPIQLDAKSAYPTVDALPGGPFSHQQRTVAALIAGRHAVPSRLASHRLCRAAFHRCQSYGATV
jgi:hypothetical protein